MLVCMHAYFCNAAVNVVPYNIIHDNEWDVYVAICSFPSSFHLLSWCPFLIEIRGGNGMDINQSEE